MNTFIETIHHILGKIPLSNQWIDSLIWIPLVWISRQIWLRVHFKSHPDWEIERKRRAVVMTRNVAMIMTLLGLFMVWATQIIDYVSFGKSFALCNAAIFGG